MVEFRPCAQMLIQIQRAECMQSCSKSCLLRSSCARKTASRSLPRHDPASSACHRQNHRSGRPQRPPSSSLAACHPVELRAGYSSASLSPTPACSPAPWVLGHGAALTLAASSMTLYVLASHRCPALPPFWLPLPVGGLCALAWRQTVLRRLRGLCVVADVAVRARLNIRRRRGIVCLAHRGLSPCPGTCRQYITRPTGSLAGHWSSLALADSQTAVQAAHRIE
jgi:hypothetical protein